LWRILYGKGTPHPCQLMSSLPQTKEKIKDYLATKELTFDPNATLFDTTPPPTPIKTDVTKRVRPDKTRMCQAGGVGDIPCAEKRLCKAHVITRKFNSIRNTEENILWLCKEHEAWFNQQDIRVWFTWVRTNYPEKFKFVEREFEYIMNEYEEFMKVAYAQPKLPLDTKEKNGLL